MSTREATYEDIADSVLPGDVIAFAGADPVSAIIKAVTRSPAVPCAVLLLFGADGRGARDGARHAAAHELRSYAGGDLPVADIRERRASEGRFSGFESSRAQP